MHPMYHHAVRLVGQPVYVHANGQIHHGVLHQVTDDGVYLRQVNGAGQVSGQKVSNDIQQVPLSTGDKVDAENVFWPLFFLPWLAIAALGPWWW